MLFVCCCLGVVLSMRVMKGGHTIIWWGGDGLCGRKLRSFAVVS